MKYSQLLAWLQNYFENLGVADAELKAEIFIEDVRQHSGLLLDRGGRQFGFIHLTFMEYLAGVAIAKKIQGGDISEVVNKLGSHLDEPDWHEVILLAIAHLAINLEFDDVTSQLLKLLLEQKPGEAGQAALIVGLALTDIGSLGVDQICWNSGQQALLTAIRNENVAVSRRLACADVLAEIGDPRIEIKTVDAMQFCRVPAGEFFMGSDAEDENAFDAELQGAGEYNVNYDYFVARYPLTVAQFHQYLKETNNQISDPRCLQGASNTPVVWVDWNETIGFCHWLNKRWSEMGLLPEGYRVCLPSEPEWEKAARGGLQVVTQAEIVTLHNLDDGKTSLVSNPFPRRTYPWGDTFLADRLNSIETHRYKVSGVGVYPKGVSPYGCEELSGNVWEWTRSIKGDYPYPDKGEKLIERESLDSADRRVLRGGAFDDDSRRVRAAVRAAVRFNHGPGFAGYGSHLGFRIVVSPLSLNDENSGL